MNNNTKSIFIAITGRPNAGKSTLMNTLVGDKVAIVSNKPQTTRTRINGILTQGDTQFVFIDTPGIHKGRNRLSDYMNKSISESVKDVEIVVLVADCTKKIGRAELDIIAKLKSSEQNAVLVLNKVDLIKDKTKLLSIIEEYSELYPFKEIIPISAKDSNSRDILLPILSKYAIESPFYFPENMVTDQSERAFIAEFVREKLLWFMNEEIPHGIAVEVESLKRRTNKDKKILDIGVVIYCEKASHKGMIIGKQGQNLKKIATLAREQLADVYEDTINLQCWVKVKENWRNHDTFINDMGLGSE
ncbi:MAG: GTPase Era [Clostridiales bacterium]|nr:GTPase Era [Clostridiales bacterium]